MINSKQFVTIQGWMVSELGLKGNDLIIYAIIYGFTQTGEGHCFKGSLQYLQDWSNSSRQGVIKNLKSLVDAGYICKIEAQPTNWYYCNLSILKEDDPVNLVTNDVNKVNMGGEQSLHEGVNKVYSGSEHSLHNNINTNINNNIDNNIDKYQEKVLLNNNIESIISTLNSICKTRFKSNTSETKRLIKARLKEGFTVDDFKTVITSKWAEWGEKPFKFSNGTWSNEYLRPCTLFGSKFESYLYEASLRKTPKPANSVGSVIAPVDTDVSDMVF